MKVNDMSSKEKLNTKFAELVGAYNMLPDLQAGPQFQPLKVYLDMQDNVMKQIIEVLDFMRKEIINSQLKNLADKKEVTL